ncbi:hypothetical protein NQ314_007535 [Rhamnusium bicolor]|uniref:Titin n=1 Tax=Rhamnusium bicolor TaxID=1586634 RepID=A0AAV8YML6_9CUCU|nr:hypothetical protein NQ314_007535 [Rhamnusium bicolor]
MVSYSPEMIQEGSNAILLISTTYEEDSGTFSCRATSSAGQVEQSAKLIVKRRPGTFRKSSTTDITAKDQISTYSKQQFGPGPGGVGKTTLKATPGSKGGQPLDENELPGAQKPTEDQIPKPLQAQPWTQEQITLKKTTRDKKEIAKEKLETVELKRIDTKLEENQKDKTLKEKLYSTEDTTLMKVDEEESIEQSRILKVKDWRKQKKPQQGTEKYLETEETTLLSVDETERDTIKRKTEDLKSRDWRKPRHPTDEKIVHTEDKTLLELSESEEQTISKKVRKPRKEVESEEEEDEEEIIITAEGQKKLIKKLKPKDLDKETAESVPWNKQEIVLKKAPREKKEIPKEKLEEVTLKPTTGERETIPQEKVITLEPITKTTELIPKDISRQPKEIKTETTKLPEESDTKLRPVSKDIPEEPIPWNKQEITLRKTSKEKKDISKEKLQDVSLKPTYDSDITKQEINEAKLTEQVKYEIDSIQHIEDKHITDFKETSETTEDTTLTTKSWRRGKKPIEEKEKLPITDSVDLPKEETETIDSEKPKAQRPRILPLGKEEPVPWNQQQIILKKTQREKKEELKDKAEEIDLKDRKEKIHHEETSETPLQHIEDKSIIRDKPEEIKETKLETKSWRRGKEHTSREEKRDFETEVTDKLQDTEITPQLPKQMPAPIEKKEEPIPWNKQEISLKKTQKVRKEEVKEQMEEVQLKPIKLESSKIETEETKGLKEIQQTFIPEEENVYKPSSLDLKLEKPIQEKPKKPLEQTVEPFVEATTVAEETKLEAKSWRRGKDFKEEKAKEVKPELIQDVPEQKTHKLDDKETKPLLPKQKAAPSEKIEETIPWNKQEINLKKTQKGKKDVEEKIEEVQLNITLKPQSELTKKEEVKDEAIIDTEKQVIEKTKVEHIKIERPHEQVLEKPLQFTEDKSIVEDANELIQETKLEAKSWRRGKPKEEKPKLIEEILEVTEKLEDEIKPQLPEQKTIPIETKEELKEEIEEKIEEVHLKPLKPKTEKIETDEAKDKTITDKDDLKVIPETETKDYKVVKQKPEKPLQRVEDKTVEDTQEIIHETKLETKTWPRGKTPKEEKPKEEIAEIIEKGFRNKRSNHSKRKKSQFHGISKRLLLKRHKKEKKEEVKETIDEVQLRPLKSQAEIIKTEEGKVTDVKELEHIQPLRHLKDETIATEKETEVVQKIEEEKSVEQILDKQIQHTENEHIIEDTKKITQETKLETKSWRRGKAPKEEKPTDKPELIEETLVDVTGMPETEETKEQIPKQKIFPTEKKEEPVPWNKQEINLKRTQKGKKEEVKEVEEVHLKPLVPQSVITETKKAKDANLPGVDQIKKLLKILNLKMFLYLKNHLKLLKKIDIEEIKPHAPKLKLKDKEAFEDIKPKEEIPETVTEKPSEISEKIVTEEIKPQKLKQKEVPLEKEEPIPWNKQEIVLKKAHKGKKEQIQEKIDVQLKPIRRDSKTVPTEEVQISELEEISHEHLDIQKPEEQGEAVTEKPQVREWRRPKRPIQPKETEKLEEVKPSEVLKDAEQIRQPETLVTEQSEIIEPQILKPEKATEEKLEEQFKPDKTAKSAEKAEYDKIPVEHKEKEKSRSEEKLVPWTEEVVTLKRTPKISQPLESEEIETVSLKPLKKTKDDILKADSESSSEEANVIMSVEKSKKRRKKKKKPLKPQVEETQLEEPKAEETVDEISTSEISKIPETVIVETVTEVEDTIVLKVDEGDKKKPKFSKNILEEETQPETIKLKSVPKTEKIEEHQDIEKISLKPVTKPESIEIKETKEKKRKGKKPKEDELPEIEDVEKYVPEVVEKVEFEETPKEHEEKPSLPWRREIKPKEEKPAEEKPSLKIGKGKIPEERDVKEEVKLKPIKKDEKPEQEKPDISKPIKLPESDLKLKEYEKHIIEPSPVEKKEIPEVAELKESTRPEESRKEEEITPEISEPWRRTPKKKEEKIPEVKEWPRGKRKPAPEEDKEDIKLKPIAKSKPELPEYKIETEEIKREWATETPITHYDDKIEIKPIESEEKLEDEITKRKRTKPRTKIQPEETEKIDLKPIPKEKEEEKPKEPEVKEWRRGKQKEKPVEETKDVEEVQVQEEKPELIPTKIEDTAEEIPQVPETERSETEIKLIEKKKAVKKLQKKRR